MVTLYGIKNCDKIRAAKRWLDDHQVGYHFHDYRVAGIPDAFPNWINECGWQALINRRSTSWRSLTDAQRQALDNETLAGLVEQLPTLIKRPLLTLDNRLLIGFEADAWADLLLHTADADKG